VGGQGHDRCIVVVAMLLEKVSRILYMQAAKTLKKYRDTHSELIVLDIRLKWWGEKRARSRPRGCGIACGPGLGGRVEIRNLELSDTISANSVLQDAGEDLGIQCLVFILVLQHLYLRCNTFASRITISLKL